MRVQVQSLCGRDDDRRLVSDISQTLHRDLHRYDARIRNIEVLVIDDDESPDDKCCIVEARLPGCDPIAVRARGRSFERAVHAGAEKLEEVICEKLDARRSGALPETVDWPPEASRE